jgi:hypothetical protein
MHVGGVKTITKMWRGVRKTVGWEVANVHVHGNGKLWPDIEKIESMEFVFGIDFTSHM